MSVVETHNKEVGRVTKKKTTSDHECLFQQDIERYFWLPSNGALVVNGYIGKPCWQRWKAWN